MILGASNNPARFSFLAANRLKQYNHEIVPVGLKQGEVAGELILDIRDKPIIRDVDTITMYINPRNQESYYDYILQLNPRRIIFNPGTENEELVRAAREKNIRIEYNCTLVMLSNGSY